jgi:adenine-specific DNA-methyltransferase
MADELDGLLARVDDPDLRADLRAQIDRIRAKRTFGLVFESHLPERVRLPEHPIRAGASVALRDDSASATYQVLAVRQGAATVRRIRDADGSRLSAEELASSDDEEHPLDDLVVVADFGQPIYPGIRTHGSVERGGDKPAHVVIKGENHHVLEALQFTHAGKVDCIYIDPPYNTGARDWKYDNRYVDDNDAYRHSKWLAFMERRLLLAKELLNPERSVLIVTIDEKEYLRLGLLLEQVFPNARIQMVSIVINPSGTSSGGLSRVDEYAFYCFVGSAQPVALDRDLLTDDEPNADYAGVRWLSLMRGGNAWYRSSRPNLCYPVLIDDEARIVGVGDPWDADVEESDRPDKIQGLNAAWPVRADGRLGIWRVDRNRLMYLAENGFAHSTGPDEKRGTWTILYLLGGTVDAIEGGELEVVGRGPHNEVLVEGSMRRTTVPKTVWKSSAHTAGGQGGTVLLNNLLGERNLFTYPKSLYAVEDAVAAAVGDQPGAIVLDFFAGSGTTAHAVARLNQKDGGHRQSVTVTNNEVSASDADALRKQGLRPGDTGWEVAGIYERVTRPRIEAAIRGSRPNGEPIPSKLRYLDGPKMAEGFEENVTFAELVYLDPDDVELGLAFAAVAPLLWLRAGAQGPIIEECLDSAGRRKPYAWTDRYGVLFNPDRWRSFVEKLPASATTAFVVTDSQAIFAGVTAELPDHLEVVRLYENYLTTFRINEGLG